MNRAACATSVLVAIALAGCGGGTKANASTSSTSTSSTAAAPSTSEGPSPLRAVAEQCTNEGMVRIGDGGFTAIIDGADPSPEPGGANPLQSLRSLGGWRCLARVTNAPDSVVALVEQSTPLSGTQKASWNGLDATWTVSRGGGGNVINMTVVDPA